MSQSLLRGTSVSPGFAVGVARVHSSSAPAPVRRLQASEIEAEVARFDTVLERAKEQLKRDAKFASERIGDHNARIFESQLAFLGDAMLRETVRDFIRDHHVDAASAVERALHHFSKPYEKMLPSVRRDILNEVRAAWGILLVSLRGGASDDPRPRVVVCDELTPAFATMIERGSVAAVLAANGGRYSHGAILARSFGVPAIVGVRELLRRVSEGALIAVNGDDGTILVDPTPAETQQFESRRAEREQRRAELQAAAAAPAKSKDGVLVSVLANVDTLHDLEGIDLRTVDGIGLYRTEYLYLDAKEFPSEDEQTQQYRRALEKLPGKPVVFRTLDSGGDKPLPYFVTPPEANPAMGWRGLRISLEMPDLFIPQLRAILRAALHGDARILLPMVTSVEELLRVRELLDSTARALKAEGVPFKENVPLGAMIEVPAAALSMDAICDVADFVSIGTNDLVQYLLGVDRDNNRVSALYDPFHPGVLRLISEVTTKAAARGREVSLCGELAGDPQTAPLLVGLGLRILSMAPVSIPQVKQAVRSLSVAGATKLAAAALAAKSSTEAREQTQQFVAKLNGEAAG
jgi:phosphotransferase system enzyme I (PtsI)